MRDEALRDFEVKNPRENHSRVDDKRERQSIALTRVNISRRPRSVWTWEPISGLASRALLSNGRTAKSPTAVIRWRYRPLTGHSRLSEADV